MKKRTDKYLIAASLTIIGLSSVLLLLKRKDKAMSFYPKITDMVPRSPQEPWTTESWYKPADNRTCPVIKSPDHAQCSFHLDHRLSLDVRKAVHIERRISNG